MPSPAIRSTASSFSSPTQTRPGPDRATDRPMSDLMNTQEVAAYLRIKERKIYDLVRQGGIPCTRVGGKWLFPKDRIDQWLERAGPAMPQRHGTPAASTPRVMAGSHDPFLEW